MAGQKKKRPLDADYTSIDQDVDNVLRMFDGLYRRAFQLLETNREEFLAGTSEKKERIQWDIWAANAGFQGLQNIYIEVVFRRAFGAARMVAAGIPQDFWDVRRTCEDQLYALMAEE